MTTKVRYRCVKNSLKIRIKIHGIPSATFDTGVYCPKEKFDLKKQISGYPKVQYFMDSTAEAIRKLFFPGATPQSLWADLLKQRTEAQGTHKVSDAFGYYFRTAEVVDSTKRSLEAVKSKVTAAGLMDTSIKDINGVMMRDFVSGLVLKNSTAYEVYVRFNTVLNRYIRDYQLDIKLPKGIIKRHQAVEMEQSEYLVWDELQKLITVEVEDDSDRYGRDLWCLMALTGMAISDLLLFHPDKNVSDDGKWLHYSRKKTKNKCSIPLILMAREIIERYEWPVKIATRTIQYKSEGIVSRLVGRKMKTHGARKTFGTVALEWGYSIESVSKFLGHANPMITANIYAKVTQAKIEREMKDIPEMVRKMMQT